MSPTYIKRPKELGGTVIIDDQREYGPLAIGLGDNPNTRSRNTCATLLPRAWKSNKRLDLGHTISADNGEQGEVGPHHRKVMISQTVFEWKKIGKRKGKFRKDFQERR